eukprot:6474890-Amphidinium_carterae.1
MECAWIVQRLLRANCHHGAFLQNYSDFIPATGSMQISSKNSNGVVNGQKETQLDVSISHVLILGRSKTLKIQTLQTTRNNRCCGGLWVVECQEIGIAHEVQQWYSTAMILGSACRRTVAVHASGHGASLPM